MKARGVCCASATAALRACARAPGTRALARAAHTRPQSPTTQWWAPPCEAASLPPPRAASACLFASTAFVITRCFCGAARERERERAAMRLGSAAAAGARSRAHQLVAMQALEVVGPLQHARRRRRRRRHAVAEAAPEPVAQRGLAEGAGAGGHVRGGRACGGGMRRRCGGAWPHVTVELVDAAGRVSDGAAGGSCGGSDSGAHGACASARRAREGARGAAGDHISAVDAPWRVNSAVWWAGDDSSRVPTVVATYRAVRQRRRR